MNPTLVVVLLITVLTVDVLVVGFYTDRIGGRNEEPGDGRCHKIDHILHDVDEHVVWLENTVIHSGGVDGEATGGPLRVLIIVADDV